MPRFGSLIAEHNDGLQSINDLLFYHFYSVLYFKYLGTIAIHALIQSEYFGTDFSTGFGTQSCKYSWILCFRVSMEYFTIGFLMCIILYVSDYFMNVLECYEDERMLFVF